jgi:hypothetical protein
MTHNQLFKNSKNVLGINGIDFPSWENPNTFFHPFTLAISLLPGACGSCL